ncbi:MAG: ATP-binding protein [Candidatus Bipolaricaulaceae bacterium]
MTELAVISGKGGTGKTTVVGSLAALAEDRVTADCDVDAANLHLVLGAEVQKTVGYEGSEVASIDAHRCTGCGTCSQACRFGAISIRDGKAVVDPLACEGCGVCAHLCPVGAARLRPRLSGWVYVSATPYGTMVHGELRPGEEATGKLVAQVKRRARELASLEGRRLVLVDGAPGIGCPVIASLSGASAALMVTEPSLSALHDLGRAVDVARHFRVKTYLAINKADLDPELSHRVEEFAQDELLPVLAHIPYDDGVLAAQVAGRPVVVHDDGPAARAIRSLWANLRGELGV